MFYLLAEVVEGVEDARCFRFSLVVALPLRITLKALPSKSPSSVLHTDIVEIAE